MTIVTTKHSNVYVVNFNHEQVLLHIKKLKLMLNYWGFAMRNILIISEVFFKIDFQTVSLQLFCLIAYSALLRVQYDIYCTLLD